MHQYLVSVPSVDFLAFPADSSVPLQSRDYQRAASALTELSKKGRLADGRLGEIVDYLISHDFQSSPHLYLAQRVYEHGLTPHQKTTKYLKMVHCGMRTLPFVSKRLMENSRKREQLDELLSLELVEWDQQDSTWQDRSLTYDAEQTWRRTQYALLQTIEFSVSNFIAAAESWDGNLDYLQLKTQIYPDGNMTSDDYASLPSCADSLDISDLRMEDLSALSYAKRNFDIMVRLKSQPMSRKLAATSLRKTIHQYLDRTLLESHLSPETRFVRAQALFHTEKGEKLPWFALHLAPVAVSSRAASDSSGSSSSSPSMTPE